MAAFAVMLTGVVAAGILGFSAHRAGVCTVKAVAEISSSGRAYMLAGFANAALWVILLTATLGLVIGPSSAMSPGWGFSTSTLIAGLVFGSGAALNSACVFSTLSGLADGRVGFLFSILGLAAGASLPVIVPALSTADSAEPLFHVAEQPANALVIMALLPWAMWQTRRLWQGRPREPRLWNRMGAQVYRLSTGALIIGLANGVLFYLFGNWMFTAVLDEMIQGSRSGATGTVDGTGWLLFVALLLGMFVSAVQRRSFRLRRPTFFQVARSLAGGGLMGLGAAIAPGGNASLLLYHIPAFSPHALPAYLAVLLGIAVAFQAFSLFGMRPPSIVCAHDVCPPENVKISDQATANRS